MKKRNVFFLSMAVVLAVATSSGRANTNIAAIPRNAPMTLEDVEKVIAQAVTRATQIPVIATNAFIAVVDREGFVLGVWTTKENPTNLMDVLNIEDAITKAGTASFLSSDQHAFTSRTAGFIVQQHFPPGIRNKPTGPLVGVNFSNMSFSDVNYFKNPHTYVAVPCGGGGTNGAPIAGVAALSGLAGSPGGVPLYKNGRLIGGVGVAGTARPGQTGIPALDDIQVAQKRDIDEDVALAGQVSFRPTERLLGSHVFIDGIRVPYVSSSTRLGTVLPLGTVGTNLPEYALTNSPLVEYCLTNLNGITGEVRATITNDTDLSAADVARILGLAAKRASFTRAGIRLPRGVPMQIFIAVVNNPPPGMPAKVLGTFRTPDATLFSWDVAVQKARTAVYFSQTNRAFASPPLAFSSRTVGFLAQRAYPPGIAAGPPGPLLGLQEIFSALPRIDAFESFDPSIRVINVLNGVFLTNNFSPNPELPNGITIFPGGFPLYRNGVLIGAIGVSGDGIDQDDIASASGTVDFLPPQKSRADYNSFRRARLPYAKFPRNPSL